MVTPAAPLRIVFFGTPEFAIPTLNSLLASQHPVVGVVTQPDRPSGRGQRLHPSPVREVADAHSLPLLQPERLRDEAFLNALRELNADLGVVAAYGKILSEAVLGMPRLGLVNVHASLLPKYRGAAPIQRAIMAGERETGVTIMRVVKALDAGPILSSVVLPIGPEETSVDVELHLASLGAEALVNAVDAVSGGTAVETPQDESAATYAHKLHKSDGILSWAAPADVIHNQIRGLHPWPHACSELDGVRCLLLDSRVEADGAATLSPPAREPGTIVEATGDSVRVQTGRGVLRVLRLQMQGRRAVSAREFLAGHHLKPGSEVPVTSVEPMISPARVAAFEALRAVASAKHDLPAALAAVRPGLADERDRSLATDLVTGSLRWQNQLDFLIAHYAKRPLARLDFDVLQILRLGAYQLLHLDRVPAAAAVNDAVAQTRRAKKSSASGLVNAVLRELSRNRHRLPLPSREDAPLDYLEVALSHPRWLARRWSERLGFAGAEAWESFNNAPAPLTIRVNRLKSTAEALSQALAGHGVKLAPCRFARDGFTVTSGNPLRTPLAASGLFFVQDEASQLVSLLGMPRGGESILDACASPGGKTTAMAAATRDEANIVAADVRNARVQLLRETVASSGARRIQVVQADLHQGLPFDSTFDLVCVDVPCSGLGTLRRDPDIRWRRDESDLARFGAAQLEMLRHAAAAVRPGGRLVYSTCSSEPEENDEVVDAFLRDAPAPGPKGPGARFELVDLRGRVDEIGPMLDERGLFRTSPVTHGLEAFFGAVLRREAPER